MPVSLGRQILETLIGKTIAEISHTDREEYDDTKQMYVYLFFTDGTTLRVGSGGFQIFRPKDYRG